MDNEQQLIEMGENVLRHTIKKLNKQIRECVTDYNKSACSKGWRTWDYNEVFKTIANEFAGADLAVEAANAGKPLYLCMKYPTLIAYNHFLNNIVNNLQKYPMGTAIKNARGNFSYPQKYYSGYYNCVELSYDKMLDGINAVRAEMSKKYGQNNVTIYYLDAVMNERKEIEEERAKIKMAKKVAKAATAKKVATNTFGTTKPQTKQAYEVDLWAEESGNGTLQLKDVQSFDEDAKPVYEGEDGGYYYADGEPYYGNVYNEERNICMEQDLEK